MFLPSVLTLAVCLQQIQGPVRYDPLPRKRPNVVLLVLDDVGVDLIGAYAEAPVAAPCTPVIDGLAAGGLMFRNAWANPLCSPTRAQILTGRHGFRTGVGEVLKANGTVAGLPVSERTLPEVLYGYQTAALGKWHLAHPMETMGDGQGPLHPLNSGFDYFAGSLFNLFADCTPNCPGGCTPPFGYGHWIKSINATIGCTSLYATTDTVDETLSAAASLAAPWFLYVSFNAPHLPYGAPPAHLCPGLTECACPIGATPSTASEIKEMVEALDTEIGRLLAGIDGDPVLILLGDNGTEGVGSEGSTGGCFDPARAKGTLYEAGVNVPLIISGPGVPALEIDALVSATDVFATIAELGRSRYSADDAVSLVPYMEGDTTPLRTMVYAEAFAPNGVPFAPTTHVRAVRDAQYKLIRSTNATGVDTDQLYDLVADPCESTNLFPPMPTTPEEDAYQALMAELVDLGVD